LPTGEFTKAEAAVLLTASYLAFVLCVVGALLAAFRGHAVYSALFLCTALSVGIVKRIYSRRLCAVCDVDTCPFNKRRRGLGSSA